MTKELLPPSELFLLWCRPHVLAIERRPFIILSLFSNFVVRTAIKVKRFSWLFSIRANLPSADNDFREGWDVFTILIIKITNWNLTLKKKNDLKPFVFDEATPSDNPDRVPGSGWHYFCRLHRGISWRYSLWGLSHHSWWSFADIKVTSGDKHTRQQNYEESGSLDDRATNQCELEGLMILRAWPIWLTIHSFCRIASELMNFVLSRQPPFRCKVLVFLELMIRPRYTLIDNRSWAPVNPLFHSSFQFHLSVLSFNEIWSCAL